MGRYYNGDINGKFWFAVQNSDDADFFGVSGEAPNYLEYYFSSEDIEKIEEGIQKCKDVLGDNYKKLADFFNSVGMYNNEQVAKETGIPLEEIENLLIWYARLELGLKILNCVKKNGSCSFTAEL